MYPIFLSRVLKRRDLKRFEPKKAQDDMRRKGMLNGHVGALNTDSRKSDSKNFNHRTSQSNNPESRHQKIHSTHSIQSHLDNQDDLSSETSSSETFTGPKSNLVITMNLPGKKWITALAGLGRGSVALAEGTICEKDCRLVKWMEYKEIVLFQYRCGIIPLFGGEFLC